MHENLTFLLDNVYIRFGIKLFRQIVGIPMDTNCILLVADSIRRLDIWDDLLDIDNKHFDGLSSHIFPSELQFNQANSSETEAPIFGFAFLYFRWVYFMINLW